MEKNPLLELEEIERPRTQVGWNYSMAYLGPPVNSNLSFRESWVFWQQMKSAEIEKLEEMLPVVLI